MSLLREHLAKTLAKKVDAHGIVVWEDPHGEYAAVAEAVCPMVAHFACWNGSWYRLRHQIEEKVSGSDPPRLLIYQGVETPRPDDDPLAELRDAGTVFRLRLGTLVRQALEGELTETRVEDIATQAKTFADAESAETASSGSGVRLPAALGTTDTLHLALRILADDNDAKLSAEGLWEEAQHVLQHAFGGKPAGEGQQLKASLFRHLLLVELGQVLGRLPVELKPAVGPASAEQRGRSCELLAAWRADRHRAPSYRESALQAERDLRLQEAVRWSESLAGLDSFPALETLALGEVVRRLEASKHEAALQLATTRQGRSLWVRGDVPEAEHWAPLWAAAAAVSQLGNHVARHTLPSVKSPREVLSWYAEHGWQVDRAHRRMEAALTELGAYGPLEPSVRKARGVYETWLEELLQRFSRLVEQNGLDTGEMLRQGAVHKELVSGANEPVAYLLVDALRYELGRELAGALEGTGARVELQAAAAAVPTITLVGMANLMPGADAGLVLSLDGNQKLQVLVDDNPVRGVPDRVNLLRAAHGEVVDLALTELFDLGETELRERIGSARLVLVRSQEIDDALESDKTAAGWHYVRQVIALLTRAVVRLGSAGISQLVIAADHGFLILSRALGQDRIIPGPGGQGQLHERCWTGKGGSTHPNAVRLPLADVGVRGALDLVVPRGLAAFAVPGSRRFYHSGLSPQELLIPVLAVRQEVQEGPSKAKIVLRVTGNRIVTGGFSAVVEFQPDLFTPDLPARLVARNKQGQVVAQVRGGDGYDEPSGVVTLTGGRAQTVRLVVTKNLAKGDRVILEVYDARTDRRLARSEPVPVAAAVEVGDDLD
jgi:hypothetical protein